MLKNTLGIAIILGLVAAGLPALAESAIEREYKDRAEIEKLMWQYTRALDTGNADAYVATFTPDGEFRGGSGTTKGREALHKMITGARARFAEAEAKSGKTRPAGFHTGMNPYLEFIDKDHAILRAYWTTTFAPAEPGASSRVAGVGWERNELVRINGKWLIQVRDTAPKDKE